MSKEIFKELVANGVPLEEIKLLIDDEIVYGEWFLCKDTLKRICPLDAKPCLPT